MNDYETSSKKWTDKKKTCSLCFVNVFKFQENKFRILYEIKDFIGKKRLIKKRFLGKATGHNRGRNKEFKVALS